MQLTFPLCGECDAARQRVGSVESKRVGLGCLLALPIGVLGYFGVALLVARDSLSWFGTVAVQYIPCGAWLGMLLGWVIAYVVVYLVFGKKLSRESIDPHDHEVSVRVESAVKITGYEPSSAWAEGEFVIQLENPAYALEFEAANAAGITRVS